jgi:hypothetical protein
MRIGVVIVCQFLHARSQMFEYRASRAIEPSGVGCVLTSIRVISYEERQWVNRSKTAPRVVGYSRIRSMSVINRTVRTVSGTCSMDICYMATLKNELPRSDNVLFVFYDFETTQDTKVSESATLCS